MTRSTAQSGHQAPLPWLQSPPGPTAGLGASSLRKTLQRCLQRRAVSIGSLLRSRYHGQPVVAKPEPASRRARDVERTSRWCAPSRRARLTSAAHTRWDSACHLVARRPAEKRRPIWSRPAHRPRREPNPRTTRGGARRPGAPAHVTRPHALGQRVPPRCPPAGGKTQADLEPACPQAAAGNRETLNETIPVRVNRERRGGTPAPA
jgi:hypothetical protein